MIVPTVPRKYRPALRIFDLHTTVGAGLLANASDHSPLQRLTYLIRQQVGSYRFWCRFEGP
jgi:hypothetical protein